MRPSRDVWILILVFVVLVVAGYFVAAPDERETSDVSSSYSADPKGVKAFYTLLGERLGYKVERLIRPWTDIPRKADVLIVVEPLEVVPIGPHEVWSLEKWIKDGGTAIFVLDNPALVPTQFHRTKKLGKGEVYAFSSRSVITNEGLRGDTSSLAVLNAVADHAKPGDVVVFDEYHHATMESQSIFAMMSRKVKVALVIMLAAGLILCHTRARRFGAVRRLPSPESIRPGYEFVESVARLYQRAHAADLAADILCKSFRRELCQKLGLAADADRDAIVRRLGPGTQDSVKERVNDLLRGCDGLSAGQRLSESELVTVASEVRSLEQELGL